MRNVRIAHVTTISESLEVLLLDQLVAIRNRGFDVCGVSAPGRGAAALERHDVQHYPVPFVRSSALTPGADLGVVLALIRLFRSERFTIVHTHTAKADLYAAIAARIAGIPIVVTTLHGFLFHGETPPARRMALSRLAKLGMTFCDSVLSQNPEDVDTAVHEGLCRADKIEYLGNGIDLHRFDPSAVPPEEIEAVRASLGLSRDAFVIGFVGRLVAEKGVLDLLQAFEPIRARVPQARLLLVGDVDSEKADAIGPRTAERFGLGEACSFTGYRKDLPALYSLMDVVVLPSHREGFPRTPMEAAAMGRPVVATQIRGCRTAVSDGHSGILVPPRDPGSLAHALIGLAGSPARRRVLGENARRLALRQFDQRAVFARVLHTYDRLLASRAESPWSKMITAR